MLDGFFMGMFRRFRRMSPRGRRCSGVLGKQDLRSKRCREEDSRHENHEGGSAHEEECEESRASSVYAGAPEIQST
jgi:hypothetical protein